jgi:hypothetical protein
MLITNVNTGNQINYSLHDVSKLIKPLGKIIAYCVMIFQLLSVKTHLSPRQLSKLLEQLIKFSTYINTSAVNILLKDGTLLSSGVKAFISQATATVTLTYVAHVSREKRLKVRRGNIPRLAYNLTSNNSELKKLMKSAGTISTIMGVGGKSAFEIMNQVIMPQFGGGKRLDQIQKQVVSILFHAMHLMTVAIVQSIKEGVNAAKADKAIKLMVKTVNDQLQNVPRTLTEILRINPI